MKNIKSLKNFKNVNTHKLLVFLSIFIVAILVTGCTQNSSIETQDTTTSKTGDYTSDTNAGTVPSGVDMETDSGKKYSGEVLAGDTAPYIVFNIDDYQKAFDGGKVIFLYFYSEWSDTAKADQKIIYEAFNGMTNTQVVGFRVNFDDEFTDGNEKSLSESLGVDSSRTRVILKDKKIAQKTVSDTWNSNDYKRQIGQYLN